jgi:hypothetical protein
MARNFASVSRQADFWLWTESAELRFGLCISLSMIIISLWKPVLRIRIRMFLGLPDPHPVPSSSKNSKKNLDFYCSLTSLWLFTFEEWCTVYVPVFRICMFGPPGFVIVRAEVQIRVSGSIPNCHGSATLMKTGDSQHTSIWEVSSTISARRSMVSFTYLLS